MTEDEIHNHFEFPPADPVAAREDSVTCWAEQTALAHEPVGAARLIMRQLPDPMIPGRAMAVEDAYRRLIGHRPADRFREAMVYRIDAGGEYQ